MRQPHIGREQLEMNERMSDDLCTGKDLVSLGDNVLDLLDRAVEAQSLDEVRQLLEEVRRHLELILDLIAPDD